MLEGIKCDIEADRHKQVMVSAFELVAEAKELSYDDDVLFNMLFDMVLDYQKTSFELLARNDCQGG